MIIFLTSLLKVRDYSVADARVPIAISDENGILTNIRKSLKRTLGLVVVANDPYDAADNDDKLDCIYNSFCLSGINFEQKFMLDARNANMAGNLVSRADMVILTGGKCVCQNKFFADIGLKEILKSYDGTVIGVSAGAMNLCKTVANFPEEKSDLPEPRWLDGMGFADEIIIPHYDGETDSYQFECEDFDIAKDYILPMSRERVFTGVPNGAYIMIDQNGHKQYFGAVYSIENGKSKKRR